MDNDALSFLHPYFLGPYAENDHVFERTLLEFFRDHAYWRRNFHPENRPPIPAIACYREDFNEFLARMQQELHKLSADLKKSVPFFSPRYLGHMAADLLLPGVLAQIMTMLYNPNNVSDDAAPATLEKELEVGFMLAEMFGFSTDPRALPTAWGHLTSGGTIANYEGLWNLRAVKYYPISLAEATRLLDIDFEDVGPKHENLRNYSKWELFNLSIRETVDLMQTCLQRYKDQASKKDFILLTETILQESLENLGMAEFFLRHRELRPPVVVLPISAHYSWQKAVKILGIGTRQIVKINTDDNMRMRADHLGEVLDGHLERQQPILAVIGVLGSTEFGSVDPIHHIVAYRERLHRLGLFFGIHVDAAWGGYMTAIFRNPDGSFIEHENIRDEFQYFPAKGTWKAFRALSEVDSITVDPHKLGFLPFPSGAFISRDAGVLDFIHQKAAYVFDVKGNPFKKPTKQKLLGLGQYIIEGSKPGSAAAAAYVAHRVLPLHHDGFGKLLIQTMKGCEYFYDKISEVQKKLAGLLTITVPFPPDTNLICYAINPRGNRNLAIMNHFSRKVFAHLKTNPEQPMQSHHFFASFTSLGKTMLQADQAERVLGELKIDPATFCEHVIERTRQADHIFIIRNTLMNPWLMYEENGVNYIDRYFEYFENRVVEELGRAVGRKKRAD